VLLINVGTLLLSTATYTVVVCCSVRIWLHMWRAFAEVTSLETSGTKAVANYLNVVLVFQAVIPFCMEMFPVIFLCVTSLLGGGCCWS